MSTGISLEKEIWKPIKGFRGIYEVSSNGRVRSLDRRILVQKENGDTYLRSKKGKVLAPKKISKDKDYVSVCLRNSGIAKYLLIHRVVAFAFILNKSKLPCINHKDSDPTNNKACNLEWVTYKKNTKHGMESGKVNQRKGQSIRSRSEKEYSEIKTLHKAGLSQRKMSRLLKIPESTINSIIRRYEN